MARKFKREDVIDPLAQATELAQEGTDVLRELISSSMKSSSGLKIFGEILQDASKTIFGIAGHFLSAVGLVKNIRDLWTEEGVKRQYKLSTKIGLTALYAGSIALAVVATAVTFTLAAFAAPIVAAVASGYTLVRNTVDFFKESLHTRALSHEIHALKVKLSKANIDVEKNLQLYTDIKNLQLERKFLENQKKLIAEYKIIVDLPDSAEKTEKLQEIQKFTQDDNETTALILAAKQKELAALKHQLAEVNQETDNGKLTAELLKSDIILCEWQIEESKKPENLQGSLREKLDAKLAIIDAKLIKNEQDLSEKQKFVPLFRINPTEAIRGDIDKVYAATKETIAKETELKLAKIKRTKKLKSIFFAAVVTGLAISLCAPPLWPLAGALTAGILAVGIATAISSGWDLYKKRKVMKESQKSQDKELTALEKDLDKKFAHLLDTQEDNASKDDAPEAEILTQFHEAEKAEKAEKKEEKEKSKPQDETPEASPPKPHNPSR